VLDPTGVLVRMQATVATATIICRNTLSTSPTIPTSTRRVRQSQSARCNLTKCASALNRGGRPCEIM